MSKIYDLTLSYKLARRYLAFNFKRFYSEYIVIGRENIPAEGPVIFAPNHTNALMDALAVQSIAPKNISVTFLARSDIFKNNAVAKFLRFAKIMPAFRMRDGIENLAKNTEIFNQCVEILEQKNALGIMPEGNQEIERKLRPLAKGIFRIAFAAQQKVGTLQKVKIVPVGIDYGDILKSNKHVIINIGNPIEVSGYMSSYNENPVKTTNEIREKLRIELENLTLHLSTENHYNCFEIVLEIANKYVLDELKFTDSTVARFEARQEIANRLISLEKYQPLKIKELELLSTVYMNTLKELKLKSWIFDNTNYPNSAIFVEILILTGALPFLICGFILNCLPFFIPFYIRKHIIKAEFKGFYSSLQLSIGMITFPLFYTLQTFLFYSITGVPLWGGIIFLIIQFPLGKWALKWYKKAKKLQAKLRYRDLDKKKSSKLLRAQDLREQIIRMIFK